MSKENRTVANLAREIQKSGGGKYTEALREAQKITHLDVLPDGQNGSILPKNAETWLPVLTKLRPSGNLQWRLINLGPGINCIGLADKYFEEVKYWVAVSGPIDNRHNSYDAVNGNVEDLVSDDTIGGVFDSLEDAYSIRIARDNVNTPWSHLDLRSIESTQDRVAAIIVAITAVMDSDN